MQEFLSKFNYGGLYMSEEVNKEINNEFSELSITYIPIAELEEVNKDLHIKREVEEHNVEMLVQSISDCKQIFTPILITPEKEIISGMHRLAAMKALSKEKVPCIIIDNEEVKELIKIDENIMRGKLDFIEYAKQLHRRKELYEEFYPELKSKFRGNSFKKVESDILSFTKNAAARIKVSKRTIERGIEFAKKLTDEREKFIRNHNLNKNDATILLNKQPKDIKKFITEFNEKSSDEIHKALIEKSNKKPILTIERKIHSKLDSLLVGKNLTISQVLEKLIKDNLSNMPALIEELEKKEAKKKQSIQENK